MRYLERQAYLEAASVEAFERFACELIAFGAPFPLIDAAMRARADEAGHYELVLSLGRRFDPTFCCPPPVAPSAKRRSLYAFAFENAVEGCVRETWGALLARYQSERASDGALRKAFARIARDEMRHAELAWSTHQWLATKLSAVGREEMRDAMASAVLDVLDESEDDGLGPDDRALLGLPTPAGARAMLLDLRQTLWHKALAA
ncbi:MAG TPA: hypothetical protein VFS43_07580 [Polyangiaceae bacterium]|nr:hypothetical protein [Polyangiaceae bacterium]